MLEIEEVSDAFLVDSSALEPSDAAHDAVFQVLVEHFGPKRVREEKRRGDDVRIRVIKQDNQPTASELNGLTKEILQAAKRIASAKNWEEPGSQPEQRAA